MPTCAPCTTPASGGSSCSEAPDPTPRPSSGGPARPRRGAPRGVKKELSPEVTRGRRRRGMALRGPAFTTPEATVEAFAFPRELGLPIPTHVGMAGFPDSVDILNRHGL